MVKDFKLDSGYMNTEGGWLVYRSSIILHAAQSTGKQALDYMHGSLGKYMY